MRTRNRVADGLAGLLMLAAPLAAVGLPGVARAQPVASPRQERQQRLVDRATLTAEDILSSGTSSNPARRFLTRARGVMVCPSIFRMSFVIGGSGGGCALLARDGAGSWSDPAFYSMISGSVGFQAGIQDAQLMLFIMTQRGLTAIMDSQFKFGANASITLATLGAGVEGATSAALNADIVAVEKSSGLFAGLSLQGSALSYDSAGNRAYYGQPVGVQDITVAMRVNNPGADPLRAALMRYGGSPAAAAASPYPAPYQRHTVYDNPAGPDTTGPETTGENTGPVQLAPPGQVQSQSLPPPH